MAFISHVIVTHKYNVWESEAWGAKPWSILLYHYEYCMIVILYGIQHHLLNRKWLWMIVCEKKDVQIVTINISVWQYTCVTYCGIVAHTFVCLSELDNSWFIKKKTCIWKWCLQNVVHFVSCLNVLRLMWISSCCLMIWAPGASALSAMILTYW